jgi:hypothetical protein
MPRRFQSYGPTADDWTLLIFLAFRDERPRSYKLIFECLLRCPERGLGGEGRCPYRDQMRQSCAVRRTSRNAVQLSAISSTFSSFICAVFP